MEICAHAKVECPNGCRSHLAFRRANITTAPQRTSSLGLTTASACPNGCRKKMNRNQLKSHVTFDCSRRLVQCQFCGESIQHEDEFKHAETCDHFPAQYCTIRTAMCLPAVQHCTLSATLYLPSTILYCHYITVSPCSTTLYGTLEKTDAVTFPVQYCPRGCNSKNMTRRQVCSLFCTVKFPFIVYSAPVFFNRGSAEPKRSASDIQGFRRTTGDQ